MTLLRAAVRGLREVRSAQMQAFDASAIPSNGQLGISTSGVPVNERTAQTNGTVFACVRLKSDAISMLPAYTYKRQGLDRIIQTSLPGVLQEPYPRLDMQTWAGMMEYSLVLRGNAYAWVTGWDRNGYPSALLPIHPDRIRVKFSADGSTIYSVLTIGSANWTNATAGPYDYGLWEIGPQSKQSWADLPPEQMLHIRGLTPPGSIIGLSPIAFAAQTIGAALAEEQYAGRFFSEGTTPSGILHSDQDLTSVQAQTLLKAWLRAHSNGSRLPAVLGNGLQWQAISITPEEAQFLQTREFSKGEICGWFGVPPHMVQDISKTSSWGKGVEEQMMQFVMFGLGPDITRFESALSRFCLPRGTYMRFDTDELLRAKTIERFTGYMQARQAGWLNADEIRHKEGYAPIPDGKGQDYLQPLNMAPMGSPAASGGLIQPATSQPDDSTDPEQEGQQ